MPSDVFRYAYYSASYQHYEADGKTFVKVFAIDDDVFCKNHWGVSAEALQANIDTLVGRPLLGPPSVGHGPMTNDDDILSHFEATHTIGKFVKAGISNGQGWGIAEVTDPEAIRKIKSGEWKYVSPQIYVNKRNVDNSPLGEMVRAFQFRHIAFVDNPAYGGMAGVRGVSKAPNVDMVAFAAAIQHLEGTAGPDAKDPDSSMMNRNNMPEDSMQKCMQNMMSEMGMSEGQAKQACSIAGMMQQGSVNKKNVSDLKELLTLQASSDKNMPTDDEFNKLKKANETLTAQITELSNREKARLDAEVSELAGRLADLKVKAGILKAEERDASVEGFKKLGAESLTSAIRDFEAVTGKLQAAQEDLEKSKNAAPQRDVAVSFRAGTDLSNKDDKRPNAMQALRTNFLGERSG